MELAHCWAIMSERHLSHGGMLDGFQDFGLCDAFELFFFESSHLDRATVMPESALSGAARVISTVSMQIKVSRLFKRDLPMKVRRMVDNE
jgi:hypothetical protein